MKSITEWIYTKEIEVKILIVVFYAVGIVGSILPSTSCLFLRLFPYALLLSFLILMAFHTKPVKTNNIISYLLIYFTGFGIEIIGVNTGAVFGHYTYGDNLGVKIAGTPLLIGLNWLFLSYLFNSVVSKIITNGYIIVVLSAFIMVLYDFLLEQIAPHTGLWYWHDNAIPLQNYLVWFILGIIFQFILKIFRVNTQNKIAGVILSSQFVFLLTLTTYFKITA